LLGNDREIGLNLASDEAVPKWVKIGFVLLLSPFAIYFVAGLLFYRPDSLEYHVKAYLKEKQWSDRDDGVAGKTPEWVSRLWVKRKSARKKEHQMALIRFGFLQESIVAVSNASANAVMNRTLSGISNDPHIVDMTFLLWDTTEYRVVRFVSKTRDAEFLTDRIREADVPETKDWLNTQAVR
jgi:hypothetical protein